MSKDNSESAGKKRPARNISKRTSKRRGELAELAFVWKAASLGFTVAKPYGDSDRYDFIVDSGGRLVRVQVKSVNQLKGLGYMLTTHHDEEGQHLAYSCDDVDFLAGYIVPEECMGVDPDGGFGGTDQHLHLSSGKRRVRHLRKLPGSLVSAVMHEANSAAGRIDHRAAM